MSIHSSPSFEPARQAMLRQLVERGIKSTQVLAAMDRVPRERFVPPDWEFLAYADRAVQIGCGQTISQPYIVALMSEALQLTGVERVLEIGTGSGYQTALLAELASSVVSLERHEELSRRAQLALAEFGYTNVELVVADGTLGWPEQAPYDRIMVAAAADHIPPALEAQLSEGGILVIPLGDSQGQVLRAFHKVGGRLDAEWLSGCRFVPLVGAQAEPS
ncbi:MAG: protein-L-isoaspartate(D-aspartate) O-methyltransferase [Planctomycetia bacterium]|nr:protein-L-isoaspartate(D-aspartate) O-methyltransferase [Planctomycetia bacterium]